MMHRICITVLMSGALTAQQPPQTTDARIAAIEGRLKQAPADAAVRDELAGAFLQKMRETADGVYLERAAKLVALTLQSDASNYEARRRELEIRMQRHDFREVAVAAEVLSRERPGDSIVWGLLGDARLELGQYDAAAEAYQQMADRKPGLASYHRIAYFRFVTGDAEGAIELMEQAIRIGAPAPENLAWCLSDLGSILFKTRDYERAERAYRDALASFPGYHPAQAGLGRVLAAQGNVRQAIRLLAEAQSKAPFPEYTGTLAKLYRKAGEAAKANREIALLDATDKLEQAAGQATNRNLALVLADLDHKPARALELARAELEVRRDVYTYDALAWALFKNGRLSEAAAAIREALSQKTPEPAFHEHAAAIFAAMGQFNAN